MAQPSGFTEHDWYDVPLYYDIIFAAGTAAERDFLLAAQRAYGLPRGRSVLEPACGSGRLVEAMAERGMQVHGFDASAPMLDFARARLAAAGLKATLTEQQMQSFAPVRPVALAHCLVSTFKYLLTEADAASHLQRVASSLRDGGIYVLGFHLSDYEDTRARRERWCVRRGRTLVTCNIQSWPADATTRTEQIRSRMVVREGRRTRQLETRWPFRTYSARQARALLRRVPELELVACHDFGYVIEETRPLNDEQLDVVLILRRRRRDAPRGQMPR